MRRHVCRKRSAPQTSMKSRTVVMQASGRLVSNIAEAPLAFFCGKLARVLLLPGGN